jgi:hypothetical protein
MTGIDLNFTPGEFIVDMRKRANQDPSELRTYIVPVGSKLKVI